jgi:uncharacterized protein (DUF697 family)
MTPDERADRIIKGMATASAAMGVLPIPVLPFMATAATGVVAIGRCYGVELTKDEAWKLIKQVFKAAGTTYMATYVGWNFILMLGKATGFGIPVAMVLDGAQSAAISYAVGAAAKAYFKGERNNKVLGAVLRNAVTEAKQAKAGR